MTKKIYKCERILFVKRPLFIARSQFYRRIGFIVVTFSGKHIYLKGKDTGPERLNKNHNTNCVTAEVGGWSTGDANRRFIQKCHNKKWLFGGLSVRPFYLEISLSTGEKTEQ